jgi:hypothetical protein
MSNQRANRRKKRSRKPVAERVRTMAASGLVEDQIASRLGVDKNELRRRYIDEIKRGKAMAAASAAEAGELTRAEKYAAYVILGATNSHWQTELGNLIFDGLDGSGAKTAADAYAKWLLDGGRWNCSAFTTNFSDERIAEFRALKIEAQKLLCNGDG